MSGTASPLPPDEGVRRALPALTGEQRARLAQRLSQRSTDRGDAGQALPLTRRALSLADPARRLVALVEALGHERLVLPARVEADPRPTGHHAPSPQGEAWDLPQAPTPQGPALVAYTSAAALAADRTGSRPTPLSARTLALTALVETAGRVLLDPGAPPAPGQDPRGIRLPRPAVASLAQGDSWLPAWKDEGLRAGLGELAGAGRGGGVLDVRIPPASGATQRVEVVVEATLQGRAARASLAQVLHDIARDARLLTACERIEIVPVRAQAL